MKPSRKHRNEVEQAVHDAEQAALGAALDNAKARAEVAAHITSPADFYDPKHMIIWAAICHLAEAENSTDAKNPVDAVTVAAHLADNGDLNKIGGGPYLHTLLNAVPSPDSGSYYAKLVAEAATRREAQVVAARLNQQASEGHDLGALLAQSQEALAGLGEHRSEWPDPIPLNRFENLSTFPVDCLPVWGAAMVEAVAEATQTPRDLAACLFLAAISTACQGKVKVRPKKDWEELCVLYTCVVLESANRKSSVFHKMIKGPIGKVEQQLVEATKGEITKKRTELEIARRAHEEALKRAAKDPDDPEAANGAILAADKIESLKVPADPQLYISGDTTPEAMKNTMAEQGGHTAVLDDEGGLFDSLDGRYTGKTDLDLALQGYDGNSLRTTRKGSGTTYIERAALTIGLTVQPEVMRNVMGVRGAEAKGFIARFLLANPLSLLGYRKSDPDPIPEHIEREYERRLTELALAARDADDMSELKFSPAATSRMTEIQNYCEQKLKPEGEWRGILKWGGKWAGKVARIAGVLHMSEHGFEEGRHKPVELDTVVAAEIIGHYFAEHALAAFDSMGANPDYEAAESLFDWLRANAKDGLSRTHILQQVRGRRVLQNKDSVSAALEILEDHGWVRSRPTPRSPKGGRPPAPRYDFHPQLKAGTDGKVS